MRQIFLQCLWIPNCTVHSRPATHSQKEENIQGTPLNYDFTKFWLYATWMLSGNEFASITRFKDYSRDKWIFSHNTFQKEDPRFWRINWRNTQFLSPFLANIRGKARLQLSEIPELSPDAKLQLKESWTSFWGEGSPTAALCLFSVTALTNKRPTSHFAGWEANLAPFPFYLLIFKFILFDSMMLSIIAFITSEKPSVIILFKYSLCYIYLSYSISHVSLSFFYIIHLFIFPACSLHISSDIPSNLLILSSAHLNCHQMYPLGVHYSATQSVSFREMVLISPGSLLEMTFLGPDFRPT